jgi:hypothetical protein
LDQYPLTSPGCATVPSVAAMRQRRHREPSMGDADTGVQKHEWTWKRLDWCCIRHLQLCRKWRLDGWGSASRHELYRHRKRARYGEGRLRPIRLANAHAVVVS